MEQNWAVQGRGTPPSLRISKIVAKASKISKSILMLRFFFADQTTKKTTALHMAVKEKYREHTKAQGGRGKKYLFWQFFCGTHFCVRHDATKKIAFFFLADNNSLCRE